MNIDLINVWPKNCDYPLFREQVAKHRKRFKRVITVFMNPNSGYDYSEFIKEQMKDTDNLFFESPSFGANDDWRDVATLFGLLNSNAKWVLFTEQDFFYKDGLWNEIEGVSDFNDVICAYDSGRMHPCFILIKRKILNKINNDFSVDKKGRYDHFGLIQKELEGLVSEGLNIHGLLKENYYHMNGLSHNFRLISDGELPVYKPNEFKEYIEKTLKCDQSLHPEYLKVCTKYIQNTENE